MEKKDVIILGAGWSGLLACKHCLAENLTVTVLEKRDGPGGVWYYSDDPMVTTVMKSTETTSSNTVTEMSDFPMPDEIGEFPHHADVLAYLNSYIERFNLAPHLVFNAAVTEVRKEQTQEDESGWIVTTADGRTFHSRYLLVCSGLHQERNDGLRHTLFKDIPLVHHSGEIKEPLPEHQGKTVLIVGGGETASDIAYQLVSNGGVQRLYWSIPRGQHFFRKQGEWLVPNHPLRRRFPWIERFLTRKAWDKPVATRAIKFVTDFHRSKPGLRWACKFSTNGSVRAYGGHGFPEWKAEAPFFHQFINKSAEVLDYVDYDRIVPKPDIAGCEGNRVYFKDGSHADVDAVVLCTGYHGNFAFLPAPYAKRPLHELYKFVWPADDPTIAFVGFVRPVIGSIPTIAEMQSRWVARVWSGRVQLAPPEERHRAIQEDGAWWATYFKDTSRRIGTLVEGFKYLDDIARLCDSDPDYLGLLKRNPLKWLEAITAPYNGCHYLLRDPSLDEQNFATLRQRRAYGIRRSLGTTFWTLVFRILQIDTFFDWLAERRYRQQLRERDRMARVREAGDVRPELVSGD